MRRFWFVLRVWHGSSIRFWCFTWALWCGAIQPVLVLMQHVPLMVWTGGGGGGGGALGLGLNDCALQVDGNTARR
jgi:hypothetical protein